jgi:hypothetical protein
VLARFGWEMRPDLHDAGMTKHDAERARSGLVSSSMSEHFTVFTHEKHPGYIEVAGHNQFWWIEALAESDEPEHYGESPEELEAFLASL